MEIVYLIRMYNVYACCPTKVLYKTGVEIVYLIRMYNVYACCPTKVLYKTGVEIVYLIRIYIYMHAVQQRYYIKLVWRLFI